MSCSLATCIALRTGFDVEQKEGGIRKGCPLRLAGQPAYLDLSLVAFSAKAASMSIGSGKMMVFVPSDAM